MPLLEKIIFCVSILQKNLHAQWNKCRDNHFLFAGGCRSPRDGWRHVEEPTKLTKYWRKLLHKIKRPFQKR